MNPTTSRPVDPAELLRAALSGHAPAPAPWAPPALADLAAAFPDLAITGLVGQGGMAAVYRAEQPRLWRTVALKIMRPDLAGKPQFAERFLREARALAALANPHVLTIHDFGERAGFYYLVTEFVDGANLRELMRLGQLSPGEVLRIVPQICAGLHFAHQHGVVHRDVKPENVLVDRAGLVKLADFGLAKLADDPARPTLTGPATVFGTPHYMAPEQWQGSAAVDHRADIYSLGVVLYELLTGRLPVGSYAPASQQPGVPRGIDDVVQRSLQQEPERRYQTVREVQRDLEQQGPATPVAPANPRGVGLLLTAIAAIALLGAAALLGLQVWHHHARQQQVALWARAEANERLTAAIRAAVDGGTAWTGALPEPLPHLADLPLAARALWQVNLAGGLGFALLVLGLAAIAYRRARHPTVPRWQFTAAALLSCSPLLAAIGAGCWALGMQFAVPTAGAAPLASLFAIAASVVYTGRTLWQASARRTAPKPGGNAAFGVVALAGALTVVLAAFLVVDGTHERHLPEQNYPLAAARLAGMTRLQVLRRMGPPTQVSCSPGRMLWGYPGLDGVDHADAVTFHDGIVTSVFDLPTLLVPAPLPAKAPYAGQTVAEVIAALGAAREHTTGTDPAAGSSLRFADVSVLVSPDGIVTFVQR